MGDGMNMMNGYNGGSGLKGIMKPNSQWQQPSGMMMMNGSGGGSGMGIGMMGNSEGDFGDDDGRFAEWL